VPTPLSNARAWFKTAWLGTVSAKGRSIAIAESRDNPLDTSILHSLVYR